MTKDLKGGAGSLAAVLGMTLLVAWPQASPAQEEEATVRGPVDTIVVTARRVEERAQDVPMMIDVLGGGLLAEGNITRPFELQFNVPGLVVNNFGAGARFTLRGVGDEGGSGLSVATHINGVYLGSSNLAVARMFDIERVEVLKGPQGTLYGRNATGGSINIITRRPDTEFGGDLEVAYGTFNTVRMQGALNIPFGGTGGLRLAAAGSDGDGYMRNSIDNRRFGEDDFRAFRGTLDFDLGDRVWTSLMAQHVVDDGGRGQVWAPRPDFLIDPDDIRLTTVTLENPFQRAEATNTALTLGADLGAVTLTSITGYARSDERELRDCAGQPVLAGCVREVFPSIYRQISQEFQLSSQSTGPFSWIVGAYYFDANSDTRFRLTIPAFDETPQNDNETEAGETSYAFFGQSMWDITERLSLTTGLRYSNERRTAVDKGGTGLFDSPVRVEASDSWDSVSWRIDLQYLLNPDVMTYGSISTGFKSGGVSTNELAPGEFETFGPEDLTAYELGIKSQSLDGRFVANAAAFYYDFQDLQVLTTIVVPNVGIRGTVDNAARARIYGLETSANFAVTDRFDLAAGMVWMPEREFVEFESATGEDLSGNKVSRAPAMSLTTSAQYSYPMANGILRARLEYNYRSEFYFLKENLPFQRQDSFGLLNAWLRYERTDRPWYLFLAGRNLLDEDYFTQMGFQSAPGLPTTIEVGVGARF